MNYLSNHEVTKMEVSAIKRIAGESARWWREITIRSPGGDIAITLFADSYGQLIFDFEPEEE